MSQKAGNHVHPPIHDEREQANENPTLKESLTDQHHGENTKSPQDDRKIGQHNQAGRPPLMKK